MVPALRALEAGQDQALHTSAMGNCKPIPALALALNGKAGQPLKRASWETGGGRVSAGDAAN